ncbi:uncharacterized protein LOC112511649 isoform X1 [Cynara cardunculus var. scolymus]|uniref:Dynein light chain, type 1/2 n=2 Tax=Cynara cardunculus var. scolymus TaxID=59895 RepID=A0A103XXT6_CYNCS|nr:uncharacterized protein LOC112511649 isoform X1 [Cynara cardunculus var. scolymus]KVH98818.1 hypothetical protein Ccrd_022953 [Cynara cardunculus var. scolymus]
MSHNSSHRRNFPVPNPEIPIDPHHRKPTDPSITTVQNISNHFSRLYLNHKARSSLTQPISDSSSTTASLTKSQSQRTRVAQKRGKPHYYYTNKPVKEHPQTLDEEPEDNIKRAIVVSSSKIPTKKEEEEEEDVKGYVNLIQKSGDDDDVKKLQLLYDVKKQQSLGMVRGRRRSFGGSSQAELADFFACNGVKVVSADMPPYMQIHVVDVTRKTYDSLEKFTAKTLALTLKKEFDGVYGPAWHCIVGSSFGSFVTHSVGGFMYFSMDQKLYVLLFKTAVQRAH